MAKQITRAESALITDTLKTTSLIVAEKFGKRHDDVIRKIEAMHLPEAYRLRNFAETVIERPNPSGGAPIRSKAYELTRDGFALLVMGFTGQRAMGWKIRFLEAFNAMERRLSLPAPARPVPEPLSAPVRADGILDDLPHPDVLEWALTVPLPRDLRVLLAELARLASPGVWINEDMSALGYRLRMHEALLERRLDALRDRALLGWRRDARNLRRANFVLLMPVAPSERGPRIPTHLATRPAPRDDRPVTWAQLRLVLLDATQGASDVMPELERLFNTFCLYQEADWQEDCK